MEFTEMCIQRVNQDKTKKKRLLVKIVICSRLFNETIFIRSKSVLPLHNS